MLKVPVAERSNVLGEYFCLFTVGRAENRDPQHFSPGVHYLISPERTVFGRSFLPERTFAVKRNVVGRTSAPRRRVAVLSTATRRWSRRGREVLLGKQDLPKSATAHE